MPTTRKYADHAARQRAYLERRKAAELAVLAAKNMPATSAIPAMPSTARWKALSQQAQAILQTLQTEMENYRDDRSESWQEGERGQTFDEVIDRVTKALETVSDIAL